MDVVVWKEGEYFGVLVEALRPYRLAERIDFQGKSNRVKWTYRNLSWPAVSQICSRTTVSLSSSTTRFVRKLAPTVDVVLAGENWFFTYLQ